MLKFFMFPLIVWPLFAYGQQLVVRPDATVAIDRVMDQKPSGELLKCSVIKFGPTMDFLFRMQAGYAIDCPLHQFAPGAALLTTLRVTPKQGKAVYFQETYKVPAVPPEIDKKMSAKARSKLRLDISGGVTMGEGQYLVKLLLLDQNDRAYRKQWTVTVVHHHAEKSLALRLGPNQVEPLMAAPWDGKLADKGIRLTVLLHAASISPWAGKFYAWDRTFLLESLTTLLRQMPCQSVKVVAFNLDQQVEIFRQDHFDATGFDKLGVALQELQLGKVSYKALQQNAWAESLVHLVRGEASAKDPADAVVFLGPSSSYSFSRKVPAAMMSGMESGPQFFYFEYFAWAGYEFADSIEYLTHDLNGIVYHIHSADQLGEAVQKMSEKMKATQPGGEVHYLGILPSSGHKPNESRVNEDERGPETSSATRIHL